MEILGYVLMAPLVCVLGLWLLDSLIQAALHDPESAVFVGLLALFVLGGFLVLNAWVLK